MKLVAATLVLASSLLGAQAAGGGGGQSREREPLIQGRVVDALTAAPISGAVVSLRGRGQRSPLRPQLTNAQGRFLFQWGGGPYTLSVTRPGYLQESSWDPAIVAAGNTGRDVSSSPASAELLVTMWPTAEIAGTVRDVNGTGVAGVTVRADPMPRYPGLSRQFWQAVTDDRGEYRLADVRPGSYIVGTSIPLRTSSPADGVGGGGDGRGAGLRSQPALRIGEWFVDVSTRAAWDGLLRSPDGTLQVVPSVYYPGTRDPGEAEIITLQPGQTHAAVDLALSMQPGFVIRGTVLEQRAPRGGVQVMALLRRSAANHGAPAIQVARATTDSRGRFLLAGVPAGGYRVVAFPPRPTVMRNPVPEVPWGEADVDVVTDVADLDVNLERLPPFTGVVRPIDTPAVALPLQSVGVTLEPDVRAPPAGPGIFRVTPAADGQLELSHLIPGDYAIQLALPTGWTVASMSIDGRPLAGRHVQRSAAAPAVLRIDVTSRVGSALVSVRPTDAFASSPRRAVALFPADRTTWAHVLEDVDRFKLVPVDASGRAMVRDLLPGEYLSVALVVQAPGVPWRNRQMLEHLAPSARELKIVAGGQATAVVDLVEP